MTDPIEDFRDACHRRDVDAAVRLLDEGLPLDVTVALNPNNGTAGSGSLLHLALCNGTLGVMKELLARGVKDGPSSLGEWCIQYGARNGILPLLKVLLDAGTPVEASTDLYPGVTPLMLALSRNRTAAAMLLLQNGANPNANLEVNRPTYKGRRPPETPLGLCVETPMLEAVEALLAAKADPTHCNSRGMHFLTELALQGNWETVTMLVDRGFDIDHPNADGRPATAHVAFKAGVPDEALRWLLALGADHRKLPFEEAVVQNIKLPHNRLYQAVYLRSPELTHRAMNAGGLEDECVPTIGGLKTVLELAHEGAPECADVIRAHLAQRATADVMTQLRREISL